MSQAPRSLDAAQLGAYFALIEVASLLRHAIEQQLRDAGDLSYVQFQLLARLGDEPTGSHRMTDLADGVVYSRTRDADKPQQNRNSPREGGAAAGQGARGE